MRGTDDQDKQLAASVFRAAQSFMLTAALLLAADPVAAQLYDGDAAVAGGLFGQPEGDRIEELVKRLKKRETRIETPGAINVPRGLRAWEAKQFYRASNPIAEGPGGSPDGGHR